MDINDILEKALILNPPVSEGTEVRSWSALIDLVNAVPNIQIRLTLLENALEEISKMQGCEIEAASEFAKAVIERSITYQQWCDELSSK